MSDRYWMKKTCELCPFSRSKTLWLHPDRASDFANMASNPYNNFPCHKTADTVEDSEGGSAYVAGEQSFTCHGFLTLQSAENDRSPKGFVPDGDGFEDYHEMTERHMELWMEHHPDWSEESDEIFEDEDA